MEILRHTLRLRTSAPIDLVDITASVREWVATTGLRNGVLALVSAHTTARININERESELQHDMVAFLTALVPQAGTYRHNRNTVDGRANAHAHLLGLFVNASETVPLVDGALSLGAWQSIFFVELDGPREEREVQLQLMGLR
jgi:secondary thiamine-phosphate synthase enzyme